MKTKIRVTRKCVRCGKFMHHTKPYPYNRLLCWKCQVKRIKIPIESYKI